MKSYIFLVLLLMISTPVIAGQCDPTVDGCIDCIAPANTMCQQCAAGYALNLAAGTCTVCAPGTGKPADSPNQVGDTTCSVPCISPCNICGATGSECLACIAGYFSASDSAKTCTPCTGGKGIAAETIPATTITSCNINCDPTCNSCTATAAECLTCAAGHYSYMFGVNKFCIPCGYGKGRPKETDPATSRTTTTCNIYCAPACQSCASSRTECTNCAAGFYMSAANTCSNCPTGFGKPADGSSPQISTTSGASECSSPCHASCNWCRGPAATDCINCSAGFSFDGASSCNPCAEGRTKYADTTVYTFASAGCDGFCHSSCRTCTSPSSNSCKQCKSPYRWAGSGSCSGCPAGKGKVADSTDNAPAAGTDDLCDITCASGCRNCFGPLITECSSCTAGYYRTGNECRVCDDGKGRSGDTQVEVSSWNSAGYCTVTCHANCNVCSSSGSTSCLNCKAGYYLSALGTCSFCPDGKTKLKDITIPTEAQPNTVCGTDCDPSCRYCSGTASSNCYACVGGYYWAGSGTCNECPVGFGRAPDTIVNAPAALALPGACGITCNPACKVCKGTLSTDCMKCAAGFYMSAANTCTLCPVGFGKPADVAFPAIATNPNGSDQCTVTCATGCKTCSGTAANACLSCLGGYFYAGAGTCTQCETGKGKAADTTVMTVATTSDLGCTARCHSSCLTCSGSTATDCIRCAAGHYLSATGTCTLCPVGFGKLADATVLSPGGTDQCTVTCDRSCGTCTSTAATTCLSCNEGFHLSAAGTCSRCPAGKGKAVDTTIPAVTTADEGCTATCHSSCSSCRGTAATDCLLCRQGFYSSATNTCSMCASGKGKVADTTTPTVGTGDACNIDCHPSCYTCESTLAGGCVNCQVGFWWSGAGCTACANGKTKAADTSYQIAATTEDAACTIACGNGCQLCSGSGTANCDFCAAGYYFAGAGVCTACNPGRGKAADTAVVASTDETTACRNCHPSCLTCSGSAANNCIKCNAGFYLSAAGTCSMCPPGLGKVADATVATAFSTTNGATECGITCDPSCRTCTATGETDCINCAAGFWFAGAGRCTQCGAKKGKPVDDTVPTAPADATLCTVDCDSSCLICSATSTTSCVKCSAGHYLSAAGTCSMCDSGKGKPSDAVIPAVTTSLLACTLDCHYTCKTCSVASSATDCVNCKASHFLASVGTCNICDSGKGKDGDTSVPAPGASADFCTHTCHESCLNCKGPTATDCVNCKAGFFLSAAGTCSICPAKSGKAADTIDPLPTVNSDGVAACPTACDSSCRTCSGTGASDCVLCAHTHYLSAAGTCTACEPTKGKAQGSTLLTTFESATDCVNCFPACEKCRGTSGTDCLSCKAGRYLSSSGSCEICPAGFGKVADSGPNYPTASTTTGATECGIVCHPTCRTCSGTTANDCVSCSAGYWWAGSGVCTRCEAGKGKPADSMIPTTPGAASDCSANCHASCSKCKGSGATDCLNCKAGYYLSAAGTCSICPTSSGKEADLEFPLPTPALAAAFCTTTCDSSCGTCSATGATSCLNCNKGYWWAGSGTCNPCDAGTGKAVDTTITLAASSAAACSMNCDRSCKICSSTAAGNCLSCRAAYFKSGATTCELCPPYTGKAQDQNPVTAATDNSACGTTCHRSCLNCRGSSETDCTSCAQGYFLSTAGVCSMCPSGFGHSTQPEVQTVSLTNGAAECPIRCHSTCRTCSGPGENQCLSCMGGRIWNAGSCDVCPATKGSPVDTTTFRPPITTDTCDVTCHASCQMCTGPTENDCLNCKAGYWWAGSGRCTACPQGKGKPADTELFQTTALTQEACYIYCDLCTSGCKTCTSDPTICSSCMVGRVFDNGKCLNCPDNCLTCSSTKTCTGCAVGYLLSKDGSECSKCAVADCISCDTDVNVCTKCKEKYTLKSSTECFLTPTPTANPMVDLTPSNTPGLKLDILSDSTTFELGKTESKTVSAVYVTDKLNDRKYSCQELRCTHFATPSSIVVKFDSDITVAKGVLTIERIDPTVTKSRSQNPNNRLLLDAYPLVIQNFVLMGKSNLKPFSLALRIIVGILRLPLSLLIFWKFPRWAMLMDYMVTHLRMYSLIGGPYMAYVEVIFQTVANSQILPFNFDNPFEKWNSDTLSCTSNPSLKSKNVNCSFFDNYGQNIIGLSSLAVLLVIMHYLGKFLARKNDLSPRMKTFTDTLANGYGYQFFLAKIDANHLEIILFTIISYSTADNSSKSVVGIIFSTAGLIGFLTFTAFLTKVSMGVWDNKPLIGRKSTQGRSSHIPVQDTEHDVIAQTQQSKAPGASPLSEITDKVAIPQVLLFTFVGSVFPSNKLSVWLHAGRYLRAVLLAIFVTVVKNPVEQIVLVIILETCYLCHLLLLDYRGTKFEKISQFLFQGLILLHLLFRAISTSNSLSEVQVHSVLSNMIVVVLVTYILIHIILSLILVVALFVNNTKANTPPKEKGQQYQEQQLEVLDYQSFKKPEEERSARRVDQNQPSEHEVRQQPQVPLSARHNAGHLSQRGLPSVIDMDIPEEILPEHTIKFDRGLTGLVDKDLTTVQVAQSFQ